MTNAEYRRLMDLVEENLVDFLPKIDHKSFTLHDSMAYSLSAGGKRIRPVLLLATCEMFGMNANEALPYACAIEYIHTYSLIHDDLPAMDDDDLRRGKPTNHKVYGEATAILAGDGLLHSAFEVMTKDMLLYFDQPLKLQHRAQACYEIARRSGVRGMVAGQIADIESENKQCSREMLDYIHLNKTAQLITAAIMAGASLAGISFEERKAMSTFGEALGLAFQIVDDYLDVCGDQNIIGKPVGSDAKLNKSTYASIYGIEATISRATELLDRAEEIIAPYYDQAEVFHAVIEQLRGQLK
ncbi:MAG: polyprenyl synthetase family protein [Firmicutes bacterium]|nr:polyprenyl synthetase family protein [Bacillota bacterium]MBR4073821.1 polyprenyl synthetase family protein [Bacillota bacterium]MBR7147269.1 polyprenyl synthetase family protein [Bacillota bacterium]